MPGQACLSETVVSNKFITSERILFLLHLFIILPLKECILLLFTCIFLLTNAVTHSLAYAHTIEQICRGWPDE